MKGYLHFLYFRCLVSADSFNPNKRGMTAGNQEMKIEMNVLIFVQPSFLHP